MLVRESEFTTIGQKVLRVSLKAISFHCKFVRKPLTSENLFDIIVMSDEDYVTWLLDVIVSISRLPTMNFSFLPTIDHLYEIASRPSMQSNRHTIFNRNDWESILEDWDRIEADQTHREDLRKLKTSDGKKAYVKTLLRLMRQRIRTLLASGSHTLQALHLTSNMIIDQAWPRVPDPRGVRSDFSYGGQGRSIFCDEMRKIGFCLILTKLTLI